MSRTAELPEDLRERTTSMFKGTEQTIAAHSRLRLENATYLIRRLMPTATGIGVDVRGWSDRDGSVELTEVRDYAGRLLWDGDESAPGELPLVDEADRRRRWWRLLADTESELAAVLDFATPSSCGWEELELEGDARPYWIALPYLTHKVAT